MPGYALFCTTCKKSAESRAAWITHLLHEGHQKAARSEIGRWGKAERKTALVVYANFPVSTTTHSSSPGGLSLLEHFSTAPGFLATDFVAIPELPQVAVVQFESKARAREILEKTGGAKVSINGQLVQLRKAEDYLDLEWQALLSKLNSESADGGGESSSKGKKRNRKPIDQEDDEQDHDSQKKRKQTSVSSLQSQLEEERRAPPPPTPFSLRTQYDDLCRSVEIPDEEFNIVLQFLRKLEEVASTQMPACKLYVFRTWHLKLRNLGGNELRLFIDAQGYLSGHTDYLARGYMAMGRPAYGQVINDVFSSVAEAELRQVGMEFIRRDRIDFQKCAEFACSHPASDTQFTIWPDIHPFLVEEVQACRILEYLVTFDIRVKPLYTLIFYWTNVNNIQLSDLERRVDITPEPAALEWLIMLFLCHKKVVPTPRDILNRESPARIPVIKDDVDMGFFADINFATSRRQSSRESLPPEDTDAFVAIILELVEGFFSFCIGLSSGSWILNLRDGEIIRTRDFVNQKPGVTNLTESERVTVRRLRNAKFLPAALKEHNFIGLLHPLMLQQRISFADPAFLKNVIPVMKSTAKKLQQFLQDESRSSSRVINLKDVFHEK